MKANKVGRPRTKEPRLLKCGKKPGECVKDKNTPNDWRRKKRKSPKMQRVTVTFSIPKWLFDEMEAKSINDGRSAYLYSLLKRELNADPPPK